MHAGTPLALSRESKASRTHVGNPHPSMTLRSQVMPIRSKALL